MALLPLAVPSLAFAQGARAAAPVTVDADEISLKSGGVLRGKIISLEPEQKAVILLAPAGALRVVPWAEIDRGERGKYAPDPASPPAPPAPPPPSPAPLKPGLGTPRLHIAANKSGVVLHRVTAQLTGIGFRPTEVAPAASMGRAVPVQTSGQSSFSREGSAPSINTSYSDTPRYDSATSRVSDPHLGVASVVVCEAPCDRIIDGRQGEGFFLAGEGIPRSTYFSLSTRSGDVTVQVSAGSTGKHTGGILLSVAGGVMALTGAVMLPVSLASRGGSALPAVSGGMIGLGVAMLIPGILLWRGSRTSYVLKPTPGAAAGLRFSNGALVF